ncbi:helix-turn-helix domain-containing protein [Flammeovirga aprica]|uniref:Helix-turn-helix transcriptional regulator n=1 Tax=Flammeovirga aprica JL-4 TaxID=694437 RepID=A0A7X9XD97_9BACT|nr:AraC family transcriptional regulator [Flammeovirga aprica]NME72580.1 helix-turn-helix transcriptional regulator [Flammeovirga aprica JL-4]
MKELIFKTIGDFHNYLGLEEPENPLFTVSHTHTVSENEGECDEQAEPISLTCDFYTISLKNIISGELTYGRTKYDCSNGTLLFTSPNQNIKFENIVYSSEAYHISFHKDYLNGHPLFEKIKKYSFFGYQVNEALHLSPKEEERLKLVFRNIIEEYENNQDEFSKDIILSHLETLLKYSNRYYKRQFLNRKEINQDLFSEFKSILNIYFDTNQIEEHGIPTVEWIAGQLGVSHRYMSDTIKAETGKTAIDQINLYLIEEAKNMLLAPHASISETAYKLGFEYPQYFSRLFKKKVGVSPKEYINMN